jgi:hypothetical protein
VSRTEDFDLARREQLALAPPGLGTLPPRYQNLIGGTAHPGLTEAPDQRNRVVRNPRVTPALLTLGPDVT